MVFAVNPPAKGKTFKKFKERAIHSRGHYSAGGDDEGYDDGESWD
jgi:hypothetical protein